MPTSLCRSAFAQAQGLTFKRSGKLETIPMIEHDSSFLVGDTVEGISVRRQVMETDEGFVRVCANAGQR